MWSGYWVWFSFKPYSLLNSLVCLGYIFFPQEMILQINETKVKYIWHAVNDGFFGKLCSVLVFLLQLQFSCVTCRGCFGATGWFPSTHAYGYSPLYETRRSATLPHCHTLWRHSHGNPPVALRNACTRPPCSFKFPSPQGPYEAL